MMPVITVVRHLGWATGETTSLDSALDSESKLVVSFWGPTPTTALGFANGAKCQA